MPGNERLLGWVEVAHGPVIDVRCKYLPPLNQALDVTDHGELYVLEVYQHLDTERVRTIALHPASTISTSCWNGRNATRRNINWSASTMPAMSRPFWWATARMLTGNIEYIDAGYHIMG